MDWDEVQVNLQPDLLYLWQGVESGERRLQLAQLLIAIPKFIGIPARAPENNHRRDGQGQFENNFVLTNKRCCNFSGC